MNISGIRNDLHNAINSLSDISGDVNYMVIIDGNNNSAGGMKDMLFDIKTELSTILEIIEENAATIQSCCEALGISVRFY